VIALVLAAAAAATTQSLGHGAWSWFGDPRAVTSGGRTYVGWVDRHGDVRIAAWMARTGRVVHGPVLKRLGRDDHDNPSILIRRDGRLMVFFSPHSGHHLPPPGVPRRMYYRVSRRPGDVRRFGPLRHVSTNTPGGLGYTYPNPVRVGRAVRLFWRGGNWQPSTSTWRPRRGWTRARTLIRVGGGNRPYVKYAPVPRRRGVIDVAFTEANPGNLATSIYYARLRGDRFRRAGGRSAGRFPLTVARADRVYDGRGPRGRAWMMDTASTARGRPVILFATYHPGGRHVVYRYATFSGGRWSVRRLVDSGPPIAGNYPAGASLDHSAPGTVLLSRRVGSVYEIERWRTRDRGATWAHRAVTSGSRKWNIRPVVPRGGSGTVVWMRGGYRGWRAYMTSIRLRAAGGEAGRGDAGGAGGSAGATRGAAGRGGAGGAGGSAGAARGAAGRGGAGGAERAAAGAPVPLEPR
jgi:hypothetical protein